jgi:septal ring factor EnvC (AmiA/AmiB activator)
MEQITNILIVFALLSLTILASVCVMFILKAQKAVQDIMRIFSNLSQTVQRIEEDSKPVFSQLETTLQDTSTTMKSLQKQMTTVEGTLDSIKQIADRVNDLEAKLQAKIEKPVMQAAGFVSGITNAIETFISEIKK